MGAWEEELALVESAANRMESLEAAAERRLDDLHAAAEASGDVASVRTSPELRAWLAARDDTDIAWARWTQVMDAKPAP